MIPACGRGHSILIGFFYFTARCASLITLKSFPQNPEGESTQPGDLGLWLYLPQRTLFSQTTHFLHISIKKVVYVNLRNEMYSHVS